MPRAASPETLGLRSLHREMTYSVADFGTPRFVKPLVMSTGAGKLDGLALANGKQTTSLLRAALWLAESKESRDEARRRWNGSEGAPWWSFPPPTQMRHTPVTTSITFLDHLAASVCVDILGGLDGLGCGPRQHSRDELTQTARVAWRLWHFVLMRGAVHQPARVRTRCAWCAPRASIAAACSADGLTRARRRLSPGQALCCGGLPRGRSPASPGRRPRSRGRRPGAGRRARRPDAAPVPGRIATARRASTAPARSP